jgi:NADH-quinone oxidoreductase subunit L
MSQNFPLIWIPLLPLLGAALNLLIGRKLSRRMVHFVACSSVFAAMLVAMWAIFGDLLPMWKAATAAVGHGGIAANPMLSQNLFDWISAGAVSINLGLVCDPLTAVMLVVITGIGFLIHVYSTGYMDHEPDYARYFAYLNLFTGSMLLLVLGDNLVVLFVGWEGVGLCSYLLIGFWYDKSGTVELGDANATAGKKAFIVNRIGDFAFVLGMLLVFTAAGTLNIEELIGKQDVLANSFNPTWPNITISIAGAAGLLFFIGATGKSAQIPLYVWLPDAMAGPTPVSALIHAATMVTAGVYMVARLNFLYILSPTVMGIIALVGALTALFAATIGIAQNDIKKVLAYSTVSQLGYMFLGVGVGAYAAGVFHLFTHAFFKACLFLGSGAVIHALHGEQDIRNMGALAKKLPVVRWTFLICCLAIAGVPGFSGFFSKDEVLWKAISTANPAWPNWFPMLLYVLAMAGAICTAFYMFRLYYLTFQGPSRIDEKVMAKLHPPGPSMAMPLVVLAVGAAVLGFLGMPWNNHFHHWLAPVVDRGAYLATQMGEIHVHAKVLAKNHTAEYGLMALSGIVAGAGILIAFLLYGKGLRGGKESGLTRLLLNKYYVDEIYDAIIVKPVKIGSRLLAQVVDSFFIDKIGVNLPAWLVDGVGRLIRLFQNGSVQRYVVALAVGLALFIYSAKEPPADIAVKCQAASGAKQTCLLDATRRDIRDRRLLQYRFDCEGDGKWESAAADGWTKRAVVSCEYPAASKERNIHAAMVQVRDLRWGTVASEKVAVDLRKIISLSKGGVN